MDYIEVTKGYEGENMSITIMENENLFASYAGLIASGYELTDQNDSELMRLARKIRGAAWEKSAIAYFEKARYGTTKVNPYWPRGSAISAACFFINENRYTEFSDYRSFIEGCGYREYGNNFWSWIENLPHFIEKVRNHPQYPALLSEYKAILEARIPAFQTSAEQISKTVQTFSETPQIVFSPNLLQMPGMADFVKLKDATVVISNELSEIAVLHEFLHSFISKYRDIIRSSLRNIDLSKCIDPQKLRAYGYTWDDSDDSAVHALEECFVRGLSAALARMSMEEKKQYAKCSAECGFLLAEKLAFTENVNVKSLQAVIKNAIDEAGKPDINAQPLESMSSFFAARAEGYDEHMLNGVGGCREGYARMAQLVPKNCKTLLDLGCGTGLELDEIFKVQPEIRVTGIDLTQAMLDRLRKKHPDKQMNLICGDYFMTDLGTERYDCAVSFQTMHHFSKEAKAGLYRKIWRSLKLGAAYIECDYMVEKQEEEDLYFSENVRMRREQNIPEGLYTHYDTPCTVENQRKLLLNAGFVKAEAVFRIENTAILVCKKGENL